MIFDIPYFRIMIIVFEGMPYLYLIVKKVKYKTIKAIIRCIVFQDIV
jgi:hypothetical protein